MKIYHVIPGLLTVLFLSCGVPEDLPTDVPLSPLETVRYLAAENGRVSSSAQADNGQYPGEIRAILDKGYIVFAMTAADQKPFFYREEYTGELIGVDVELGYEIANLLGVRAVFNRDAASFDGVVTKIVNKEADIALSKLSRTTRRAELVRYTDPYIVFRQALLVNRLELTKITLEDKLPYFIKHFDGRIGVVKNSSYVGYAEMNFPGAHIETYDTWEQTIDALFGGTVLAAYRDEGEILIINTLREDASILMKPVFINDKRDPIAMAVASDAPLLQEWLNVFLEEYLLQNKRELTPAQIVERHFGDG
ncbi:MAG: ABC transporter substrate-binding protein [Treponema sp.]|jgi:ABC-type amino acid transport substrate-binding protein|nr:ABC transporter substrate-binding protein [Treponema sp.]